jgi:triosephosphate isomerase
MGLIHIYGNWKSNGSKELIGQFQATPFAAERGLSFAIALPATLLASELPPGLQKGAQNVSAYGPGAYTGEIHAGMLQESGASFSLVGHSERRQIFGETPDLTSLKIRQLWRSGLRAVFCVGETLQERDNGRLAATLHRQLSALLPIQGELLIAYEPVWAIGTGRAAGPMEAEEAHAIIEEWFLEQGQTPPAILYGGSVSPENAAALAGVARLAGFLIGGASLKPSSLLAIGRAFAAVRQDPTAKTSID